MSECVPKAFKILLLTRVARVKFAVTGTTGKTQHFCDLVQKNAGLVRELLVSE